MILTLLALALVTLLNVFSQAFQSQSINRGLRLHALLGSGMIGVSNVFVWRIATDPRSGPMSIAVYVIAGAIGAQLAMTAHAMIKEKRERS